MRFSVYGQLDAQDATTGDNVWQGLNMTLDKPLLQQGFYSLGENTRCRTGHITQRRGTSLAADFNPPSGFELPIIGSNVFRNPNGQEVLLVAAKQRGHVWVVQDTRDPYKVNLHTGNNTGTGKVEFVQAFEQVLLLREPTAAGNLVWDGVGTSTITPGVADSEFVPTVLSTEGLNLVPEVWTGEPFMDRVIYYFANATSATRRDIWYMSDVLDYTSYDNIFQSFRTNVAEADYITRIMAYFKSSVVVFKNHSIHMATVMPTFPVSISQRILNSTVGSVGNKMPLMVGADIIFLSQPNGFYTLSEIIQEQIAALPVPISEPIQDVINAIVWSVTAEWGCSAALDNYAFFGVCVKGRPQHGCLNTILVYDTQRKQWESAGDTWLDPQFRFNALHVTNYNGVNRLFAIDYDRGIVYLLYEGVTDETPSGIFSVPFRMESRGYVGDDPIGFKRFGRAIVGLKTSDPEVTITAISDGVNEEKSLTPVPLTKDRTKFYSHGHAAFDPDEDDANAAYREDYSTGLDEQFVGQDFENTPVGTVTQIPATLPAEEAPAQDTLERFIVRTQGQWVAMRVENTSGTVEVTSIAVESTRSQNTVRTAA